VIEQRPLGRPSPPWNISYPEIENYREAPAFEGVASHYTVLGTMLGLGPADRDFVASVSLNFFQVLGVQPTMGRFFQPADGEGSVAVLSYEYWAQRLGRDPTVLGTSFQLDGQSYVVVGVAPPLPDFPNRNALFVSAPSTPRFQRWVADRTVRPLIGIARLKPGVRLDEAERQVAGLTNRLVDAYPEAYPSEGGFGAGLVRIRDKMVGDSRRTLLVLIAAAAAVLILVLANLTFLALARTMQSELEIRIRAMLGATRFQVIRHKLTEGLWVALAGGILGSLVAFGLAEVL
jgi:putative ABC transport system permease protein